MQAMPGLFEAMKPPRQKAHRRRPLRRQVEGVLDPDQHRCRPERDGSFFFDELTNNK